MSTRFDVLTTPLTGLRILQRKPLSDSRGYLERLFCAEDLHPLVAGRGISQINHTLTAVRGTVRGMHFQRPPHAEAKLVSCLRGEVFDVAVDLRRNSPTFLHWHSEILSAANHRSLFIEEGFAHGFQALTDDCEMLYFHTTAYHPEAQDGLNPQDPRLAIAWPLPIVGLSPRDAEQPWLGDTFAGVAQ